MNFTHPLSLTHSLTRTHAHTHTHMYTHIHSHTVILPLCNRKYEDVEDRLFETTLGGHQRHKASATPSYRLITDNKMPTSFLNIRQISAALIFECTRSIGEGSFGVCKKAGTPVCVKKLKERGLYGLELLFHEASVLSKLSVCFMLGIQYDHIPYCLVLNLYTVDGIGITIHDLICVIGLIETCDQDLTSKQRILKYHYATLNNTAWL